MGELTRRAYNEATPKHVGQGFLNNAESITSIIRSLPSVLIRRQHATGTGKKVTSPDKLDNAYFVLLRYSDYSCKNTIVTRVGNPGFSDMTNFYNDQIGSFKCYKST